MGTKHFFLSFLTLLALCFNLSLCQWDPGWFRSDRIWYLPGQTFPVDYAQYSGYLNATVGDRKHFHFYWLVESQSKTPSQDPIVLWLNGGPGCSSLEGFLEELGPFRPHKTGKTLFQNIYAWNKVANMFFMESPAGVGFSYSEDGNTTTDDDKVAEHNVKAVIDFFRKHPTYKDNDFYITGESYGGVYIPMLSKKIIEAQINGSFPGQFKFRQVGKMNGRKGKMKACIAVLEGIAIGNGLLSEELQQNSVIYLQYYRGVIGYEDWDDLNEKCCNATNITCNWYENLNRTANGRILISDGSPCGDKVQYISEAMVNNVQNDAYNQYQDCYNPTGAKVERLQTDLIWLAPWPFNRDGWEWPWSRRNQGGFPNRQDQDSTDWWNRNDRGWNPWNWWNPWRQWNPPRGGSSWNPSRRWNPGGRGGRGNPDEGRSSDQEGWNPARWVPWWWRRGQQDKSDPINYDTTDALSGFPCWDDNATATYLNQDAVKRALHVNTAKANQKWVGCSTTLDYHRLYFEMDDNIGYILNNSDIRILIYNGDVDSVCNFLGDEWFVRRIAEKNNLQVLDKRQKWMHRGRIAGYAKKFERIDLVTVKGAGHFVPTDRAGPALQMIRNFLQNADNYSVPVRVQDISQGSDVFAKFHDQQILMAAPDSLPSSNYAAKGGFSGFEIGLFVVLAVAAVSLVGFAAFRFNKSKSGYNRLE